MPPYMELSPTTVPGQAEEDCLYPISPQLLPSTSPYVQPHPLTSAQFHNILKPPLALNLCLSPFNYGTLPHPTANSAASPRNSASFVHPSALPFATPGTQQQPPYCLQNLQLLQLQLHHHAQLQHLRHATLPR